MIHDGPISWLTLERYALGELDESAHREVAERLVDDAAARARLAQIEADERPLRPLDLAVLQAPRTQTSDQRRSSWRLLFALGPALAAALLLLLLWPSDQLPPAAARALGPRLAIKGGEVAISLLRSRGGETVADAMTFRHGDRFKVLLSAPPHALGAVEVLVLQGGQVYLPLPRRRRFAGGNRRPLPGAFALDGASPVDVCAVSVLRVSGNGLPSRPELRKLVDREKLSREGGLEVVCQRLERR